MEEVRTFTAHQVVCFSSQYGSDNSRSYTAGNLAGDAYNFPSYGDFTQAFVLRTYGHWWQEAPSSRPPVKKTEKSDFISEDFVDLKFEHFIYPTKIDILETYNPGAVVRILALQAINSTPKQLKWTTLWSGAPQYCPPKARKFSPPLKKTKHYTNLIRLEFNQSHLDYYTELDAVVVHGKVESPSPPVEYSSIPQLSDTETSLTLNLLRQLSLFERNNDAQDALHENGYFDILPSELVHYIFSFLELIDLARAAATCRLFFLHCYDPVLYKELNLKPYWSLITNQELDSLRERCMATEKLDLSWAGPYEAIDAAGMTRFIEYSGSKLVCLRLSCCPFVDNQVVQSISKWCQKLEELDLQSCANSNHLDENGLIKLANLTKLRRVNFYRVPVSDHIMAVLIQSWQNLQHLNLGGNLHVMECDHLMKLLGENCSGLISLDLWRNRSLTADGIKYLAEGCALLEELDIGWCTSVNSATGCLIYLASRCQKLKKLFLTAIRSVCDDDIVALANHCPDIEQVDVLGTSLVHSNSVIRLLKQCKKLRFLDVSFCTQLTAKVISSLRGMHPNVSIKKSFVVEEQE